MIITMIITRMRRGMKKGAAIAPAMQIKDLSTSLVVNLSLSRFINWAFQYPVRPKMQPQTLLAAMYMVKNVIGICDMLGHMLKALCTRHELELSSMTLKLIPLDDFHANMHWCRRWRCRPPSCCRQPIFAVSTVQKFFETTQERSEHTSISICFDKLHT